MQSRWRRTVVSGSAIRLRRGGLDCCSVPLPFAVSCVLSKWGKTIQSHCVPLAERDSSCLAALQEWKHTHENCCNSERDVKLKLTTAVKACRDHVCYFFWPGLLLQYKEVLLFSLRKNDLMFVLFSNLCFYILCAFVFWMLRPIFLHLRSWSVIVLWGRTAERQERRGASDDEKGGLLKNEKVWCCSKMTVSLTPFCQGLKYWQPISLTEWEKWGEAEGEIRETFLGAPLHIYDTGGWELLHICLNRSKYFYLFYIFFIMHLFFLETFPLWLFSCKWLDSCLNTNQPWCNLFG